MVRASIVAPATLTMAALVLLAVGSTQWSVIGSRLIAINNGNPSHMHSQVHDGGATPLARPKPTVRILSCEKLPDMPGKVVTTTTISFPPGAFTPKHYHGGSVTVFVLQGTVRSQLQGLPIETYKAGDTWFEPLGAIHLFAENASETDTASALAMYVSDDCATLTTFLKD